jgi:hypothetical protein
MRGIVRSARSTFGRGRLAAFLASRALTSRSRGVVVKARVVRHKPRISASAAHLRYLRREGVSKEGEPARMFDAAGTESDLVRCSVRLPAAHRRAMNYTQSACK